MVIAKDELDMLLQVYLEYLILLKNRCIITKLHTSSQSFLFIYHFVSEPYNKIEGFANSVFRQQNGIKRLHDKCQGIPDARVRKDHGQTMAYLSK